MNIAGVRVPIVLRLGFGKRQMKGEVRKSVGQVFKILAIENFLQRARAVPEADPAARLLRFKQVRQMRAQRRHASPAAEIDHFSFCRLDMKIAKRADGRDGIAGLEAMDIGGARAGEAVLAARRRGDADIEAKLFVHGGVGGQGIIAPHRDVIRRAKIENVLRLPDFGERRRDWKSWNGISPYAGISNCK